MPRVLKAQKCLYFAPFHAQRDEMNRFVGHFIDLTGCYWLQTMDQTDPIKAALYCTPHTHSNTHTHTHTHTALWVTTPDAIPGNRESSVFSQLAQLMTAPVV